MRMSEDKVRLTSELFVDGLPEKKLQLIGMSILLILLSPGPGCYKTLNRVPHNQHNMRITQATSNPLEYLLALHQGKVKNPSQSP